MTLDLSADDGVEVDEAQVRADIEALLVAAELDDPWLSVVLTDDDGIAELNQTWRGKDGPTDVLSFPQQEPPVIGGLLGDIVVSVDTARRQAAEVGHDERTELVVLLVHGLCHLLGHDHLDDADTLQMRALEARLLGVLGISAASGLVERGQDVR